MAFAKRSVLHFVGRVGFHVETFVDGRLVVLWCLLEIARLLLRVQRRRGIRVLLEGEELILGCG